MSLDAPIRRVLVATDFSTSAATAVDWADAFARREHAELHVVHVLEPPLIVSPDAVFVAWTEALASQLESDVDRSITLVSDGRVVTRRHVRSGRPEQEIGASAVWEPRAWSVMREVVGSARYCSLSGRWSARRSMSSSGWRVSGETIARPRGETKESTAGWATSCARLGC